MHLPRSFANSVLQLVLVAFLLSGCPSPAENGSSTSTPIKPPDQLERVEPVALEKYVPPKDYWLPKSIEWRPFNEELFDAAAAENKLIFVFESEYYSKMSRDFMSEFFDDVETVEYINENFLATWFDRDRHPGLIERYQAEKSIVPAVLLVHPSGPHVFSRTPQSPDSILDWLKYHQERWAKDDGTYELVAAESIKYFESATSEMAAALSESIGGDVPVEAYDEVLARVFAAWKEDAEDFAFAPHIVLYELAELLNDAAFRDHGEARKLLGKYLAGLIENLGDPFEGGFYTYASDADYENINYAKRLDINSRLLYELSRYYLLTGNEGIGEAARGTVRFIIEDLGHEADGSVVAFYSSVLDEPEYFALDEDARKSKVEPDVDPTIITQYNFMAIEALVWAHFVLDSDAGYLVTARRVADNLIEHMWDGSLFARYADDPLPELRFSADQTWAARSLLTLYQATGDNAYQEYAGKALQGLRENFLHEEGGLLDTKPDGPGLLSIPFWTIADSSLAARSEMILYQQSREINDEDAGSEHFAAARDYLSAYSKSYLPGRSVTAQSAMYAIASREVTSEPFDFHLLFNDAPSGEAEAAISEAFTSLFPYRSIEVLTVGDDDERIKALLYTTTNPVSVFLCQGPQCIPVNPGEVAEKAMRLKRMLVDEGLVYPPEREQVGEATD